MWNENIVAKVYHLAIQSQGHAHYLKIIAFKHKGKHDRMRKNGKSNNNNHKSSLSRFRTYKHALEQSTYVLMVGRLFAVCSRMLQMYVNFKKNWIVTAITINFI